MSGFSRSIGSRTAGSSRRTNGSESVRASSALRSVLDAALAASIFLFRLIPALAAFRLHLPGVFFPGSCYLYDLPVFSVRHKPSAA